ncbi:malto-oligosyltrehalose trehalohydrolase [Roseiterribacter gracilis]|uniref:Malto-oligosyltrehalose trehalohydrolase n=1 Tax=Roseiterribacter gracilis TaxID=2812848 RepID=A0A8S8XEQ3_9PROT|nr:malto-oligosyltrehalose trehalohydrolase [Rhodospirillales bacterium TMPK1]
MIRRRHDMPWGAQLHDGTTRFRVWAPRADKLDLLIEGGATHAMQRDEAGWWSLTIAAPAGTLYRYRADDGLAVPDPASRRQPDGPHGPSEVVDPHAYAWRDLGWRGRRWEETVLYELHIGTFSRDGTFLGAIQHLDHIRALGATALEILPIAECPGKRNWGYDGVQLFAPEQAYGTPDDFKTLVEAAHERGLSVLLDVVDNHFGPEGNYLNALAPDFFTDAHQTPWGAAINFAQQPVRDFYWHNALYWLEEFDLDGLRFDAVHAIYDDEIMLAITSALRAYRRDRPVLLVIENERNEVRYLDRDASGRPLYYDAQWNDDMHHVMHVLCTGEEQGYYKPFTKDTVAKLGKVLAEGFVRGEGSARLPSSGFIPFLQNHDQIGNRVHGERIDALADPVALGAMTRILLLQPQPPLLFMGEEWAASTPWPYFAQMGDELADAIRAARKQEHGFEGEGLDPCGEESFLAAKLNWDEVETGAHAKRLALYRRLLALRAKEITPLLLGARGIEYRVDDAVLRVVWRLGDGSALRLLANCSNASALRGEALEGRLIEGEAGELLAPWSVAFAVDRRAH